MLFNPSIEAEPFAGLPLQGDIQRAPAPFTSLQRAHAAVLLADPAYHFRTYSKKGQGRSPSQHYRDMSIDELAKLPVADIAAPDCWLFQWIPDPHLPQGLELMRAWGFKFSGKAFTWCKLNPSGKGWHFGLGFTTGKTRNPVGWDGAASQRSKPMT